MFVNFTAPLPPSPTLSPLQIDFALLFQRSYTRYLHFHRSLFPHFFLFPPFFHPPSSLLLFFTFIRFFFFFYIATRFPNLFATRPLFSSSMTRYCNVSDIRSQWIHDLQFATNDSRIIAKRSSIEVHFTLMIRDDIEKGEGSFAFLGH